MLNLSSVWLIVAKNVSWMFKTVWYQCQNVHETLWYWCRTVRTLWHQSDGAQMFLGPKCLDTISVVHVADQPCTSTSTSSEIARDTCICISGLTLY